MTDAATKKYVLTNSGDNTELARVDDITLTKGDKEGQDLTEDQAKRLKEAGMKLRLADGSDDESDDSDSDAIDSIRTHEEADEQLSAAGITAAEGTTVEDKKQALRDAQG